MTLPSDKEYMKKRRGPRIMELPTGGHTEGPIRGNGRTKKGQKSRVDEVSSKIRLRFESSQRKVVREL